MIPTVEVMEATPSGRGISLSGGSGLAPGDSGSKGSGHSGPKPGDFRFQLLDALGQHFLCASPGGPFLLLTL